MFIQQVAADFADENAAVFVAEPGRDCHEINPGHHPERTEQVP